MENFAPVACPASIRTALAFGACFNLEIHHVDIKGAYLNGNLLENEQIYLCHPPGYPLSNNPALTVLKLKRLIYGLKQSGWYWYLKFERLLRDLLGMKRCEVDYLVFIVKMMIIILVSVDDLTILTSSTLLMDHVKSKLRQAFEITDLGEVHWLLGIQITQNRAERTISLSQWSYFESIAKDFRQLTSKPTNIAMDTHNHLTLAQCPQTPTEAKLMENKLYRSVIGKLMYACTGTCLDIAFTLHELSKFLVNPSIANMLNKFA